MEHATQPGRGRFDYRTTTEFTDEGTTRRTREVQRYPGRQGPSEPASSGSRSQPYGPDGIIDADGFELSSDPRAWPSQEPDAVAQLRSPGGGRRSNR